MDGSDASKGVTPMSDAGGDAAKDCSVKVAVHIRPLISHERLQGCMDCISVVPGEPQVQIGNHSFTYDHVYGSTASPSSAIFEECVAPLVDGLFQGYNATVLAYGQTGSGKTYTMGTAYSLGGNSEGVIPLGIDRIFRRVEDLSKEAEVMLKVSFIEILKEEIHDLLDSNAPTSNKSDVQCNGRIASQGKPPAQIRETCHGGITLTGVQEVNVANKEEMIAALSQGSQNRATGSTNMNNQSSRSHAIFTINLSSKRKWNPTQDTDTCSQEEQFDDFVCAKLHLVDLAGSERAKRTGADGVRLKEGIHINRGLLALGNVISALGDDKKRKERGHIPYRDSKLTRLLQDSLGGNSRTVMIACVSPADTNAEETLNTLKYANRARNIQNKAVINRDPLAAEMDKMRHQLHYLEAQLREGGVSADEIQILKHKVARLEKLNAELSKDLQICQIEKDKICLKLEKLRNGRTWEEVEEEGDEKDTDLVKGYLSTIHKLQNEIQQFQMSVTSPITRDTGTASAFVNCLDIESNPLAAECETFVQVPDLQGVENEGDDFKERESEESEKEIQFSVMQDLMDKEMRALDQRLEEKETEMKMIAEASVLKQHYEKKLRELEEQKRALQMEMDRLRSDVARLSDENSQKAHESYVQKLKQLEAQIADMRKSQESQAQLLKQKKKSDEAAKKLQDEILRIKQQRVQLQNKIKRESESFRAWKAAREKEVLKLKKEGRRNEYEMNKLQALNQRQRMVLQRKTEEAGMLTKKLKDLLESKKQSSRDASAAGNGSIQGNEKALKNGLEHELEVVVRVHEVRTAHQKQTESRAAMAKELEELKMENQAISSSSSMSPGARRSRIAILESMIDTSSKTIVDMASQLSESEERERAFSNGKSRWNQLRSMGDAKSLLNYLFDVASQSRCQARDKELEIRELKEHVVELRQLLKNSEYKKKELEKQVLAKEQMAQNPKARLSGCSISDSLYDFGNKGDDLFPYDLRKASRNYNLATETITEEEDEDMDISDGEEESDDEWTEDEDWVEDDDLEARNAKRNRASMRPTKTEKQGQCEDKDKKPKTESYTCCTCSKVSGCKTKKCECRAVGNICGSKCGCKIGNCSNREGGSEMQGDLSDSKASPENPQKPETEIKKEFVSEMQAELTDSTFTSENLTKPKLEVKTELPETQIKKESQVGDIDQALSLLQSAMKQNISLENSVTKEGDKEEQPEGTEKKSHRRPLTDIGNTSVTAPKANPRKKWKKSRIQIVPVVSQTNSTPKETMPESENSKPASSVAAATSNAGQQHQQPIKFVPQNKEPATSSSSSQESSIPLKLPRSMHRSSSSLAAAHPLRARNSSSEEGSKDMVSAPGSPSRGGSRGQNGKENVRYNN